MADIDLIGGLIATYRTLNLELLSPADTRGASELPEVREAVRTLRDNELRFSQALKERISGVPAVIVESEGELPAIGTETDEDTAKMLLSQFGTARESTLAMLRELPADDWDQNLGGDTSIRERVFERLEDDRKQLNRIAAVLDAA